MKLLSCPHVVRLSAIPVSIFVSFTALAQAPRIVSFTPASGYIGAPVTITGANFNPNPALNVVRFGAVNASILSATNNSLTVFVPDGATFDPLTVTAGGLTGYSETPFSVTFSSSDTIDSSAFSPQINLITGSTPTGLNLADLDGDGKPDLIVADWGAKSISVFRNISTNGSLTPGSFAPRVDFPVGDNPYFMAVGDIDGDGKPDLVVANGGDKFISIFRNISTPGSFSTNSFAARLDLPVGPNPYFVAIRDIDGDGLPDLIVANSGSNNISVLRNLGGGGIKTTTFAAPTNYVTGGTPFGIAIADLNNDGKPDIAVANQEGTLAVLQNTSTAGRLTFNTPVSWTIGGRPLYVAIGDLDNDGKPDIAVANYGNKFISVLRNLGATVGEQQITANSFSNPFNLTASSMSQSLALADLDGDGRLEIVVPSSAGLVSIFHNLSTPGVLNAGSFGSRIDLPAQTNTLSVVIGDLDGDGLPDIIAANDYSSSLSVFRNLTGPAPLAPVIIQQPRNAAAPIGGSATFNVIASGQPPLFYQWFLPPSGEYRGATNASFTVSNLQSSSYQSYAVVVSNAFGAVTSSVATLTVLQAPVIELGPQNQVALAGTNVTFSVTAFGSSLNYQWFKNNVLLPSQTNQSLVLSNVAASAAGSYSVNVSNAVGSAASQPATLTILGPPGITLQPQSQSVLAGSNASFSVVVFVDSTNSFSSLSYQWLFDGLAISNANASLLTINNAQSNNAGSYEVVVSNMAGSVTSAVATLTVGPVPILGITSVNPNAGPVGKSVTIFGTNFSATPSNDIVYFGAVAAHVLTAASNSLSVAVPLSATYFPPSVTVGGLTASAPLPFDVTFPASPFDSNSLAAAINIGADLNPTGISIADLDGDGKPDVIVAEWGSALISVYRNISTNGALTPGSFAPKVEFAVGKNPYFMAVADLNGDGKPDLVVSDSGSGSVSIFQNISSPGSFTSNSFGPRIDFPVDGSPYQVAVADLDGDGRPDLVVANLVPSGAVSVLRNLGGAQINANSFAPAVQFPCGGPSSWVAVGDLNGDGKPDLAVANGANGTLAILQNTSSPGVINTGSFASPLIYSAGGRPMCVVLGDLDGDGKLDIAVANNGNTSLSIYHNVGAAGAITAQSFAAPFQLTQASVSQQIALADLDGDGRPEIVQADSSGNVSVFRNIGTNGVLLASSFAPRLDFAAQNNTLGVAIGDLDGDGKPDVVAANDYSSSFTVLRNTTPPPAAVTTLQLPNISARANASFTAPVNMVSVGDENAASFSIVFDPSVLTFETATLAPGASNLAFISNTGLATNGQLGFELALPAGSTFTAGSQQLVQLTFQAAAISNPVITTISFGDLPATRGVSGPSANQLPAIYLPAQIAVSTAGIEGDVSPRPLGNHIVDLFDWVQEGRFVAGLDTIASPDEFQRADCAPRSTLGDGVINVADWVQVGRYAAGLDPLTPAGGPAGPINNIQSLAGAPRGGPLPLPPIVSFQALPQSAPLSSAVVQFLAQGDENALSFSVQFDPKAASFAGASLGGGALGAILNVNTNFAPSGRVGCAVALPPGVAFTVGNQEVVQLSFASVSYSNTTTLTFANTPVTQSMSDTNATPVNATFQSGALTVPGLAWPRVTVIPSTSALTLSWPASDSSFTLESAPTVLGPWTPVAQPPAISAGTATVTTPAPTGTAYYRLHHQ
jgi:hypothetical protein